MKYKSILIVRTDRLGDVVLSLPLARIIKEHYPECRVTFLLRDYTARLAFKNPFIDEVITLKEVNEKKFEIKNNVALLKGKKFDVAIAVNPTFDISLILFLSGIKKRIGTGYRFYSLLFTNRMYEHRKYGQKHELEYNTNLLTLIGITTSPSHPSFSLSTDVLSEYSIDEIYKKYSINDKKPTVIIHPGSGGSAVDLPVKKFLSIFLMIKQLDVNIIITGNRSEYGICTEIAGKDGINLAGNLNLGQLISLINRADLFISNSTGPLHIAAALDKNVIGFFPKIPSCSKIRWGPYTDKAMVFEPEIECNNCTRKQCERLNCMDSIDINKVLLEVKNMLNL